MRGCYRRRLVARIRTGGVDAGVEDDFHHFRLRLQHDSHVVTAIEGEAVRFPWVTCPGASTMLARLLGAPITQDAMRRADAFVRFHQCTHQLELALLAIRTASRAESLRYDVAITDPDKLRVQQAIVYKADQAVETWALREGTILAPAELAGQDARALRPWADTLDDERYAQVAILRRCLQVASGRLKAARPVVASQVVGVRNACYAFQDERAGLGYFIPESVRDHVDGPDQLLAELS